MLRGSLAPGVLALAISALGLFLRIEHALTFDGPRRGSDYAVYMQGVRWMLEHKRAFDFDPSLNGQVNYQPPLWYAAGAWVLHLTGSERAIAALAIAGWTIRQALLALLLRRSPPRSRWSALAALWLHAVLPISVLIDGKVNPEGLHAGLFMVALYFLWRMEREAGDAGIDLGTAIAFGASAGLSLLTKATSSALMIAALPMLVWHAWLVLRQKGWPAGGIAVWRRLMRPMAAAMLVFALVVGGWCVPNLRKYGHPFPHPWDRDTVRDHAELGQPTLYRRPLGWALPWQMAEYIRRPVISARETPHPNFWAYTVIGTWTDLYNRGFCRLKDTAVVDDVWGGPKGVMPHGPEWSMSGRCVRHFTRLAWVGLFLSAAATTAVLACARANLRSAGREGSLVLPAAAVLVVGFVFLFALAYPYDGSAVLNPRYLLAAAAPMCACLGLGLALLPEGTGVRRLAHASTFLALAAVTWLLVWQRFGG